METFKYDLRPVTDNFNFIFQKTINLVISWPISVVHVI
jgi:hypothetical protein